MRLIFKYKQAAIGIILFLSITQFFSCSGNKTLIANKNNKQEYAEGDRARGEYIITVVEGIDSNEIYGLFTDHTILSLKKIKNNIYLIKLANDPGPETFRNNYINLDEIIDIQPNFKYTINPPDKKIIKIKPE
jgi:hypothetical protein